MTKKLTWQDKACQATRGTQFGAIIHEALRQADRLKPGASPESESDRSGPRFIGKAVITSDGFAMCDFVDRNGEHHIGAFVGAWSDVERNMEGLAEHLKLTRKEAESFAKVIQSWIATDYRGPSRSGMMDGRSKI